MIQDVADAIARQDYSTAAKLLQQLKRSEPKNPWVYYYIGRLYEETRQEEAAEKIYRQLLQKTINAKVLSLTRQGIERLHSATHQQRETALTQAKEQPGGDEFGVLILEPIPSELKQNAAQKFAQVMQIDAYNARLQLPSRGWRLYRNGLVGELRYYTTALQQVEIPCFCISLPTIETIQVCSVKYIQATEPNVTVVCHTESYSESVIFEWREVTQRVEGLLPLFEEVVDMNARRKLQRKTKTLDYIPFCDLHLPSRNCILRFCDRNYDFQQGIFLISTPESVSQMGQTTTQKSWRNLMNLIHSQLPDVSIINDFTPFAETALGFPKMLQQIEAHIHLSRRHETLWDAAFQLYSGLAFRRQNP